MLHAFSQIRFDTQELRGCFDKRRNFALDFKDELVSLCFKFDSLVRSKTANYSAALNESYVRYDSENGKIELLSGVRAGSTQRGKPSLPSEANEFRALVNSMIKVLALAKNTVDFYATQNPFLSNLKAKLAAIKVPKNLLGKAFLAKELNSNSIPVYLHVLEGIASQVLHLRDHLAGQIKGLLKKQNFANDMLRALGLQRS